MHDDCGIHVGLAIGALLAAYFFFSNQWLYAQNKDMNEDIWKRIIRILQGFVVALALFYALVLLGRVLVYIFGWSQ